MMEEKRTEVKIVPITRDNLSLVVMAGKKFGMPRSERWFLRCLYDPTLEDITDDDVRGHMAVTDEGEIVAIQCYYYIPIYFHQRKLLMSTGCIMGADSKYGEELICCLDHNRALQSEGSLSVGNCIANKRSARFCKVYHHLKEAPQEAWQVYRGVLDCSFYLIHISRKYMHLPLLFQKGVWYAFRPMALIRKFLSQSIVNAHGYQIVQYDKIDLDKFGKFWNERLSENDGIMTSREPRRLSWMFDESLAAGTVRILTAERGNKIFGYILIRRYPRDEGFFNNYSLYDICALRNDEICLRCLMRAAVQLAADDKGCLMMYVGAIPGQDRWLLPFLSSRIRTGHSMIFYGSRNQEIMRSLQSGEGWFFGPMDGERCLGHGRHVDA